MNSLNMSDSRPPGISMEGWALRNFSAASAGVNLDGNLSPRDKRTAPHRASAPTGIFSQASMEIPLRSHTTSPSRRVSSHSIFLSPDTRANDIQKGQHPGLRWVDDVRLKVSSAVAIATRPQKHRAIVVIK